MDALEFILRLGALQKQQRIIDEFRKQRNKILHDPTKLMFIDSQIETSKQTLEVIKLTRQLLWLTIGLLILGVIQILVMKQIL